MGRAAARWIPLACAVATVVAGCDDLFRFRETGIHLPEVPECFSHGDCEDGIECTVEECHDDRCVQRRPPGMCDGYCIAGIGCRSPGMPCDEDSDCRDRDGCTVDEQCLSGACTFTYLGDRDADGDLPLVCGGGDCDDDDPERFAYARDLCNGIDDDCDGDVDETACGNRGACIDRQCVCEEGYVECDGTCVNLARDADHCGECGNGCGPAECFRGECRCPGLLVLCSGTCRLPAMTGCGDCGVTCPPGASCIEGECVCPAGTIQCGRECVDPMTSLLHCGECNVRCAETCQTCRSGECRLEPGPYALCPGGRCAELQIDPYNCGACGRSCEWPDTCVAGECRCPWEFCDGVCTDTLSDPYHCGGCGHGCRGGRCYEGVCGPGFCGGSYVDVEWDADHCSGCDVRCAASEGCAEGSCTAEARCTERENRCGETGVAEIDTATGRCEERAYEWCIRHDDWLGVVRLGADVEGEGLALPLAGAADLDRICVAGAEPSTGRVDPMIFCTDRDGRGWTSREVGLEGLVEGLAVSGSYEAWTLVTRRGAPGAMQAVVTFRGSSWMIAGDDVRGSALAMGSWPVIAGSFTGRMVEPCYAASSGCPGIPIAHAEGRDGYVVSFPGPTPESAEAVTIGGPGDDSVDALALDALGVLVVGSFSSSLRRTTVTSRGGTSDAFVARVAGDTVSWARGIGGTGADRGLAIHVGRDPSLAYVVVAFEGTIDAGGGPRSTPSGRGVLVSRIDPETGAHVWSRAIDVDAWESPIGSVLGASVFPEAAPRIGLASDRVLGDLILAGEIRGTRMLGATEVTSAGGSDVVVVRIDHGDGSVLSARTFGGPADDHAAGVAVLDDDVWVTALVRRTVALGGTSVTTDGDGDVALVGLDLP